MESYKDVLYVGPTSNGIRNKKNISSRIVIYYKLCYINHLKAYIIEHC